MNKNMDLFKSTRSKPSTEYIRLQFFDQILTVVLLISVINIISNIAISYPFVANYKWMFMILLVFIINRYKNHGVLVSYSFVTFIIIVIVPLGWYNSGLTNNNVIAYIFIITVAVSFLFEGWYRLSLVLLLIFIFCVFLYVEYYCPEFLPRHTDELQFLDRLIQVPLIVFVTFLTLRLFTNTFEEKNELLKSLNIRLKEMAYHDDLTGINNRAFIFEKYQDAIKNNVPFVSVMIDIDNFKQVNDNYGHLTGDKILKSIGHLLKVHFAEDGHIARYGGDEFILMLHLDINVVKNRLQSFIDSYMVLESTILTNSSLSGGYCIYHEHELLDEHLKKVDIALYKAKNSGKNKLIQD